MRIATITAWTIVILAGYAQVTGNGQINGATLLLLASGLFLIYRYGTAPDTETDIPA